MNRIMNRRFFLKTLANSLVVAMSPKIIFDYGANSWRQYTLPVYQTGLPYSCLGMNLICNSGLTPAYLQLTSATELVLLQPGETRPVLYDKNSCHFYIGKYQ